MPARPKRSTVCEPNNCENIIKSVWGAEHLPEGISSLIYELTGGNPFFVEEISSALIEEGKVQIKNQKPVLIQSIESLSLPNTVQSVIRARLGRLERYSRESLRMASVIGREFAQRILEQNIFIKGPTCKVTRRFESIRVDPANSHYAGSRVHVQTCHHPGSDIRNFASAETRRAERSVWPGHGRTYVIFATLPKVMP